jgi:integrase
MPRSPKPPKLPKHFRFRNGRYYVVKRHGGKVVWRSFGSDYQEAILKGSSWLKALETSRLAVRGHTLSAVAERWWKVCRRSPRALSNSRSNFKHMIAPTLGSMDVADIRKVELRQLVAELVGQGYAAWTIQGALTTLRCVLNHAVEEEIISVVPSFKDVAPRVVERAPDRLTDEEIPKLLAVAWEPWRFAFELCLLTGIRWGELRRLTWRHVVELPSPMLVLEETKSGKVRRVPLNTRCIELLEAQRRHGGDYVFPLRGKSPSNTSIRMAKRAGVRFHWHMLRHTFGCRYLENGGRIEVLQEIMGHAHIEITQRYARLGQQAVFADAAAVEALIASIKQQTRAAENEG